jgi:hypothetical protein
MGVAVVGQDGADGAGEGSTGGWAGEVAARRGKTIFFGSIPYWKP